MNLVTFDHDGRAEAGLLVDGDIFSLAACGDLMSLPLPGSVLAILAQGEIALDLVRRVRDLAISSDRDRLYEGKAVVALQDAVLLAPVPNPGTILAEGLNYRAHLTEMKADPPAAPTGFCKSPAAIIGTGCPIILPASHPDMVDWEGEFCAVIGKAGHNIPESRAMDHVAGFTLINDVSARNWVAQVRDAGPGMPSIFAWERNILGKQFPTFCPMGPTLALRDGFGDPAAITITTRLNGAIVQCANTSDLLYDIPAIIGHFSRYYQLRPGDLITTGSPGGNGFGRKPQLFLKPGDRIEIEADGIGILSNPVMADPAG